jgi:NADH dehydrogenase
LAQKKILILGGGFAGVYAAQRLERLLAPADASICLINRENYFVYQPMLPEVISGSINFTDIVSPIRRLCPRTQLILREVEEIDLERRIVTVSPGFRPRRLEVSYDYLVICLGTVTNYYGMPGLMEHALPFRTLVDAVSLRNRVIRSLEEADVVQEPELRKQLLTFVVGGGGFSGVEVIAELNDFVRAVARNYGRILPEEIRCVLVHSGERILPEMSRPLAEFAQRLLARRGVEILLKDRLAGATSGKAILKSGLEIPSNTIVSTVPSAMPAVLDRLNCEKDKGRLLVDGNLALKGYEGAVWSIGDCASIRTVSGNQAPPTAQHAIREATVVAANISAEIKHKDTRTVFAFEGLGKLGALGHNSAVAEVFGVPISGFAAWLMWRSIYLAKMPGLNRKFRIAMDWFASLLFPPDLVQFDSARIPAIREQHFAAGDIVFNQGDLGDYVYVIRSGECEVLRETDGVKQVLAVLKTGEYFGEMAVLSDSTRNATVRATSGLDVVLISKRDFDTLKTAVPAFGKAFSELASARGGGPGTIEPLN